MLVREAAVDDVPAITAIYNDAVENTTAIWNDRTVSVENRRRWLADHEARDFPVLVAVEEDGSASGEVLGYATYGDWRAFDGYRHTVEHSVYVRSDQRGRGLGRLLMVAIMERARARGKHAMVAGVEAGNVGSIRLHEKLGFRQVGLLPEVGTKFGRWLDLAFLQITFED